MSGFPRELLELMPVRPVTQSGDIELVRPMTDAERAERETVLTDVMKFTGWSWAQYDTTGATAEQI